MSEPGVAISAGVAMPVDYLADVVDSLILHLERFQGAYARLASLNRLERLDAQQNDEWLGALWEIRSRFLSAVEPAPPQA